MFLHLYQVQTDAKKKIVTQVRGYQMIPSAYVH
nr:MAG TPA: hypothetical protein [Caudoviricetes sp.]